MGTPGEALGTPWEALGGLGDALGGLGDALEALLGQPLWKAGFPKENPAGRASNIHAASEAS